jgi:hypothetical protein
MSKKYLLWLYNGESYEDAQTQLLGVFTTKKRAEKAGRQAKESIIHKAEAYKARFPNASNQYLSPSVFGIFVSYLRHEITIEEIKEDTLRNE